MVFNDKLQFGYLIFYGYEIRLAEWNRMLWFHPVTSWFKSINPWNILCFREDWIIKVKLNRCKLPLIM